MKRASTCGCTPMINTFRNPAPVARTASTCFNEISSIASANSLAMKPIDATISARMPASAPKPTALTNRIATITGWKLRHSAINQRAGQLTQTGIRLRAASSPIGSASATPVTVAITAISRLSDMPDHKRSHLPSSGGNMRCRNLAPLSKPSLKRAQVSWNSDAA